MRLGRIDIIKRSLLGVATEVQVCIISTDEILNFILDTTKFSADHALCHIPKDIDKVMATIRSEAMRAKWATLLDVMVSFILKHHKAGTALKNAKRLIEKNYPQQLANLGQSSSGQAGVKRKAPSLTTRHVSNSQKGESSAFWISVRGEGFCWDRLKKQKYWLRDSCTTEAKKHNAINA